MDGKGYGIGNYTGELNIAPSTQPWYLPAKTLNGHRYLSASQNYLLSRKSETDTERIYFSLYRMYFDNFHNPIGFVEVMKYYDTVFETAQSPKSNYNVNISVYDLSGNQLFPVAKEGANFFNYYDVLESDDYSRGDPIYNTVRRQQEYVYATISDYSDFVIVTSIRHSDFFLPIINNLLWIPSLALLLFCICYLIAKKMSRWLAFPLTKMYHFLSNIDPRDLFNEIQMEDSGIIEIDKLRDSLNSAMRSQKASTQAMLLLKEQELQAQMLALQAQMNPHFLYNSLNTIGAMAEEGMNSEVTKMCQDITSILRYISSDKESVSTVEEELEHCDLYLKCIKFIFKYPRLLQSYPRTVITEKELTQCFR